MRKKIINFTIILIIITILTTEVKTLAYTYTGYVFSNPLSITYYITGSVGAYSTLVSGKCTAWNSLSEINITVSNSTSANIMLYADYTYDNGTYAVTTPYSNSLYNITIYKAFVNLNTTRAQETVVHEIGHTLGLDHCEPVNNSISVMREYGFNDAPYPLSDDIAGIQNLY